MARKAKKKERKVEKEKLKEEIKKEIKKEFRLKKRKPLLFRFIGGAIRFIIIVIIILLIALTLVAGAAFLAYNFLPLKTISFCVSNETQVSPIECSSNKDCVESVIDVMETSSEIISDVTGKKAGIKESVNVIEGFLRFVFKEVGSCNEDGFCEIREVRGAEQIIGGEAVECREDEERREIRITLKTIIPPDKLIEIVKKAIESEEVRDIIKEMIKNKKATKI